MAECKRKIPLPSQPLLLPHVLTLRFFNGNAPLQNEIGLALAQTKIQACKNLYQCVSRKVIYHTEQKHHWTNQKAMYSSPALNPLNLNYIVGKRMETSHQFFVT